MFLRKIKFYNFRPFKGEQEVSFLNDSGDDNKTVTVLLGDNTYGKTTFVLAFIWCLYGESRFTMSQDILNKKVAMALPDTPGMTATAKVEIEFEDSGVIYTMKRTQKFSKNTSGSLKAYDNVPSLIYTTASGETFSAGSTPSEIAMAIKAIMPKDLSSFFFFEGEKNNEITKKDLGQSVRTLLGLEAYSNMRNHLYGNHLNSSPTASSVMGYYLSKQNSVSGNKAQDEYRKILEADEKINMISERLGEINEQLDNYDELIEQLTNQLRLAEPTKQLQKRRDQISEELRQKKIDLDKKSKTLFNYFSKDSLPLFITPLLAPAKEKLSSMKVSDKSIRGIDIVGIRELLHRGYCLCGTDLIEGQVAYKNVKSYEDFVPPSDLGGIISGMKDSIAQAEDKNVDFAKRFEELYSEIASLRVEIGKLENEEKSISEEFKNRSEVDTREAEEALLKYKHQKHELTEEKEQKISEESSWKTKKELATNNFNKYKAQNETAREYEAYYKYAEALYNWVNDQYSQKEKALRDELSSYISESFNRMFSGHNLSLNITEKYVVDMRYDENQKIGDTGALRVIQYFAYVGSLVKLAKNVMLRNRDGQETLGGEYPLVLDAAFSHADEVHTENIARELAEDSNQLILALMRKDWRFAKKGLEGKICKMYEFRKEDEAEVYIEEVK